MGGIERVELGALDGIGQHRRQEGAAGIACWAWARLPAASRTAAGRAARGRARSPRPASTGWPPILATACLASRAETPTRSAPVSSFSSAQRPVDIERVEPALQDGRRLDLRGALQGFDDFAERRAAVRQRIGLPDQRQGLGEVADIVVGEMEQLRADLVLAEAAQQRGLGGGEVEPAGQRRQRPAAVGIGRLAQIGLDQPQLGVAGRLVGERDREGRRRPALGAFSPRGRPDAAPRPRCRSSAHRCTSASSRPCVTQTLGAPTPSRVCAARASRHGRR